MSGKGYLLDTNIIIGLFADDQKVTQQIQSVADVFIPVIVVGELFYGAESSRQKEKNKKVIQNLVDVSTVLSCDIATAIYYGQVKNELKKRGKPIPENDVWIAALALQYNLIVVSRDKHFSHIPSLEQVSW